MVTTSQLGTGFFLPSSAPGRTHGTRAERGRSIHVVCLEEREREVGVQMIPVHTRLYHPPLLRNTQSTVTLTTEVEQVPKEETDFVEALKVWDGTLFQVSSEGFATTFL